MHELLDICKLETKVLGVEVHEVAIFKVKSTAALVSIAGQP